MHAIYINNYPPTRVRIPKTIRRWHSHGLMGNNDMQRLCCPFLTTHIKPITHVYKHYSSNVTLVKHSMGDAAIYVTFLNVKGLDTWPPGNLAVSAYCKLQAGNTRN